MTPRILIPREGATWFLRQSLGLVVAPWEWQVMLWQNDITPSWGTVYAGLEECDFTGYSRRIITPSEWQAITDEGDAVRAVYGTGPLTWTNDGPVQTVYGFAVVDVIVSEIRWMSKFTDPVELVSGQTLSGIVQLDCRALIECP